MLLTKFLPSISEFSGSIRLKVRILHPSNSLFIFYVAKEKREKEKKEKKKQKNIAKEKKM